MAEDVRVIQADLALPDHAAAVRELLGAYARDPMGGGQSLPDDVLRRVVPGLREHPGTLVYLAYMAGEPAGLAVAFVGYSTFAARPLVNVHDLAVVPRLRDRGVGTALMEAVEAKARTLGCAKLTLEVRDDNEAAQRFYRRQGFGNDHPSSGGHAMMFWTKPLPST